ncbi:MAG: hypothetical protein A3E84_03965 [Gammaproteobacteria bacterium RIFCSPHIGHO2_12_FULL_42_13]|nr:MAG: hypothetical protein A3E84_03965 [Gammaproteobacteria bacterium RIFCSPHIGHO2_12_FULL_42_13]
MTVNTVRINFFGAFRKYGDYKMLHLPQDSSVLDLKRLLAEHLNDPLVWDSAIACNDTIVNYDYRVQIHEVISILPPVCGG